MGYEYEMKYAASPEQLEALFRRFSGSFHTLTMETTYYDTENRDFSSRRYSLRLRKENGEPVCNLKIPLDAFSRGEWECREADIAAGAEILARMSGVKELEALAQQPLFPLCGARFTRRAAELSPAGCTVELALDQGILLGGSRTAPLCEVEVEHKSGSREAAAAFARALAGEFSLAEEPKSKFARAMALASEEKHGL